MWDAIHGSVLCRPCSDHSQHHRQIQPPWVSWKWSPRPIPTWARCMSLALSSASQNNTGGCYMESSRSLGEQLDNLWSRNGSRRGKTNQLLYNVYLIKMPLVTLPTAGAGHPATSWLLASSDIYSDCSESSNTRESNLKYLMTFSGCSELSFFRSAASRPDKPCSPGFVSCHHC